MFGTLVHRIAAFWILLCLAACGPDNEIKEKPDRAWSFKSGENMPRVVGPEDKSNNDWRLLFGPISNPDSIDGRMGKYGRQDDLYRCKDRPDLGAFVKSLWPIHRHDAETLYRNASPNQTISSVEVEKRMHEHIRRSGCTLHNAVVKVDRVLAWDSSVKVEESNMDRWIAFRTRGQASGFFLVRTGSID